MKLHQRKEIIELVTPILINPDNPTLSVDYGINCTDDILDVFNQLNGWMRFQLYLFFWVFQWGPFLTFKFTPFSRLTPADRITYISYWNSRGWIFRRFHDTFSLVKSIVHGSWYHRYENRAYRQ